MSDVMTISPDLVRIFNLRWFAGLVGYDPCDEWTPEEVLNLPDGLTYEGGGLVFDCNVCGAKTPWEVDPADFEFGHYANVCGGSPRCCP